MRMITLPGLGGSGDQHWQTLWERESADMYRFAPSSWDAPDVDDWASALNRAVDDEPCVLIAHSLSCLLAVRWAQINPGFVAGLFLVAVPDPLAPTFPAEAATFTRHRLGPLTVPAILVSSDDDPYCSS